MTDDSNFYELCMIDNYYFFCHSPVICDFKLIGYPSNDVHVAKTPTYACTP